jgi:hypothetical protein
MTRSGGMHVTSPSELRSALAQQVTVTDDTLVESTEQSLEDTVRRVLREELPRYRVLRKQLKDGAIRRADRDQAIATEWSNIAQRVRPRKRRRSSTRD